MNVWRLKEKKKNVLKEAHDGQTNSRSWYRSELKSCGLFLDPTRLVTADRRY